MDSSLGQVESKKVNESPFTIGGVCASETCKWESSSEREEKKKKRELKEVKVEAIIV